MGQIKNIKLHIVTDIKKPEGPERVINPLAIMVSTGEESMEEIPAVLIRDDILDTEAMKKLFVSKIHISVEDEELQSFVEGACGGNVTELQVIRKPGAKSYHYGYVTLESSELIDELIHKEKELILKGMTLEVNRAPPKDPNVKSSPRTRTKKLFVGGVPKSGLVEEDLKTDLEGRHDKKYGTIEDIQFIKKKDEEGKMLDENKGFGFVTVSSEHLADTMSIQHASIEVNGIQLEVKKSNTDPSSRGGRGRGGGARGDGAWGAWGGYGGYGGYGGWGGMYSYDGYGGYAQQQHWGGAAATLGGGRGRCRGGKDSRGGRGGAGGKR